MYKKRVGTSGIRGQLYETKLISLIHFRAKFDPNIKDYHLATNVADIGTFDDICFKAKVKINGSEKSVAVFIQAKHREGDTVLTMNKKHELAKWFTSYLTIKGLFSPGSKDVLFKGIFDQTECLFVMYTNAKDDLNTTLYSTDFAPKLNKLIGTGDDGLRPRHKDEHVVFLCDVIMKEQMATLAKQMAKFLSNEDDSILSMNDDLLLLYHVILEKKVFKVSEINYKNEDEEHRIACFRKDFFVNDDEFIILFRETLYIEMLKNRKLDEEEMNSLLTKLFNKPLDITVLSKLIGNVILYNSKNGTLEFVSKSMSEDFKRQLDKVNVLQSTVYEAIESAAKDLLTSRQFKVPAAFGNKDLTIRGKVDVNIEGILDNLKNKLVDLLNASHPKNIVTIDETLEKEFLQLNAGLASAIGNIIVADADTIYMRFTDNCELLGDLAKRLYAKVQSAIPNLHDYKLHIKVKTFPKLAFVCDDDENIEMLKDQVTTLAQLVGKFICDDIESKMSMDNDLILRYHVILAQKVIDVTEIQYRNEDEEHRVASFRPDFFNNDEEFVILFRKALYNEIFKTRKFDQNEIDNLLTTFFNEPSEIRLLSKLIETAITYNNGQLEFINNTMSDDAKQKLSEVSVSQWTIDEAVELAARDFLSSRQFKVPAAFGNKDLTISVEKGIKIERRLKHLQSKISELLIKSNAEKVVILDESLGDGLLKLSGGIAGIVGNMLVTENNTNLTKFTDNWETLGDLSKRLFRKLQSVIPNLHEYKFEVKVKKFPKLSFKRSEHDEYLAKDFLQKLLFFTNQAEENGVEKCLKDEIEDHESHNFNNIRVTADAIFLQYHHKIQKWWMLPKEASYLTKQSKLYQEALSLIVNKSLLLLTIISKIFMLKIKNNIEYIFNENAINALQLNNLPSATIFTTESITFTVAKIVQVLKNKHHIVFDLEYVLDLQADDYKTVCKELKKIDDKILIIVVCNKIHRNWFRRLENIAKDLNEKRIIIVTNEALVETIKNYISRANNIVKDERVSLIHMSEESRKNILENAKVIFQNKDLKLDSIIDEASMAFVEGDVLNNIINYEPIILGQSITNSNYEKVKHLYIDRRVVRIDNSRPNLTKGNILFTLNDIVNVALITAKPGMGKSTLLTHLSIRTKELNPLVWIVRVNLLLHSETFFKWQKNKINIDYLETLNFICEVIVSERQGKALTIELEESNGDVNLKCCNGDEVAVFELKMFLYYYNRKEVIFLFDGFDEICPLYTDEVLSLIKIVRNYPKKHKIWITSRLYEKVIATLELEFGNSYQIPHFTPLEQDSYLNNFWKSKIILKDLNQGQCNNLCNFMEFMTSHYHFIDIKNQKKTVKKEKHQILFLKVCLNFLGYLKKEINVCPAFVINTFNTFFSNCNHTIWFIEDFDTPLHLYLIADYFQHQIKNVNLTPNKWNLDINAFTVYDRFFETKLKKIRFQEKNKIDLYNPDNMIIYENVRADFFDKHRKLGAYAVFHQDAGKIFNAKELREIKDTLNKIKEGIEKTGLIHSVANGIPTFIHMTFTEYFAVEYICDLLRAETKEENQKSLWDFILNVVFFKCRENVRTILGYKIKTEAKLKAIIYEQEDIIFELLLEQGKGVFTYYPDDLSKELYLKIKLSLNVAMAEELSNFVPYLYKLKEKLTEDYLKDITRCTPRIKRLKFMHLVQKKRRVLNSSQINSPESHGEGPVIVQRFEGAEGLGWSYRSYPETGVLSLADGGVTEGRGRWSRGPPIKREQ